MTPSQIVSTKQKLHEQVQEISEEIREYQDVAAKFEGEANKETFFHDGVVSGLVRMRLNIELRFRDELQK